MVSLGMPGEVNADVSVDYVATELMKLRVSGFYDGSAMLGLPANIFGLG